MAPELMIFIHGVNDGHTYSAPVANTAQPKGLPAYLQSTSQICGRHITASMLERSGARHMLEEGHQLPSQVRRARRDSMSRRWSTHLQQHH